jgi:hypothetical protein
VPDHNDQDTGRLHRIGRSRQRQPFLKVPEHDWVVEGAELAAAHVCARPLTTRDFWPCCRGSNAGDNNVTSSYI